MDYEKKYKEALELARDYYKANQKLGESEENEVLSDIFPELKESEDERIRKNIIIALKSQEDELEDFYKGNNTSESELVSWLEKQGEQCMVSAEATEAIYTTEVETGDGGIKALVVGKVVMPKFKVGDFIVNDYCMGKVIELTDDAYLLDTGQGIPFSCEHNAHLWTIQDAKDGDVLAGKIDGDSYILIYKKIKDGWIETYGHYYNAVDRFCVPSQLFCRDYQGTLTPATKEQRDLLFQKMKEAGYVWDADKKELKKIEQSIDIPFGAKDSELQEVSYYIPEGFHAEIDGNKVVIKKGEHKSVWSEEDKNFMYETLSNLTELKDRYGEGHGNVGNCIDWLRTIKDKAQSLSQPKEWSEEDERMRQYVVNDLRFVKELVNDTRYVVSVERVEKEIDWLKSLKERNTWKPSDEQIELLEVLVEDNNQRYFYPTLNSLYEQLKKLKGE